MGIYDCFVFHDKLNILDIRLSKTSKEVDFFVIAEGTLTLIDHEKLSYLRENWDRFKAWYDNIIHAAV